MAAENLACPGIVVLTKNIERSISMHRMTALSTFMLFICTSAHAAWVPVDCQDRSLEVQSLHKMSAADLGKIRQNYRAAVLKAKPRSPLYAPRPYPQTREEIIDNFRYAYFDRLFAGKSLESLPERERPLYKALKEGRLRIDILRIENWDFSRCTGEDPSPFYYLLRFFDPATGNEVARSKQFSTGHMGIYRHASETEQPLPDLAKVPAVLRSSFSLAIPVEQPQYVMAAGLPHCWDDRPCIAFKSQGKLYLLDGGELLYEIAPAAPRISILARRDQQARERRLQPLGVTEMDTPLVTLGFEWARAQLVGGPKIR
jgi:hypothetical protein